MSHTDRLQTVAGPCDTTHTAALAPLITEIRRRHGAAVIGILFYGSCLRSGALRDGLIDFYVVVDRYRHAHGHWLSAAANHLVPPNVYYLEAPDQAGLLRAKYAVISEAELAHGTGQAWLSSLWGRLAQPTAIVYAADEAIAIRLRIYLGQAVVTLLDESMPVLAGPLAPADLFARALALSYSGELRTEDKRRGQTITASDSNEYARRTHAARDLLSLSTSLDDSGRLSWRASAAQRHRAERHWQLRRPAGQALSVARLAKACFTFGNAVDYGAWKLARHTGVEIEVSERLRRHPLIYGWPVLWRLYRDGLLR